jgi:hypothetical protein
MLANKVGVNFVDKEQQALFTDDGLCGIEIN